MWLLRRLHYVSEEQERVYHEEKLFGKVVTILSFNLFASFIESHVIKLYHSPSTNVLSSFSPHSAISDIMMAMAAWIEPVVFRISAASQFCDILTAFNVMAFCYNLTIIHSRWMTCFMAFKRCRCMYSESYAFQMAGNMECGKWFDSD